MEVNKIDMKKLLNIFVFACIISITQVNAQRNNLSDSERVKIVPYVPQQIENISLIVRNNLQSKLAQIVTKNGFAGSTGFTNRFIIVPNISVLTKEVVAGAPTRIALTLDVALFVGDGIDGTKYSSTNITVQGVGINETKAYISAIKNIKANNKEITNVLEDAKSRIIDYYDNNCNFIIADIEKYEDARELDKALGMAMSVPTVSKSCYKKAARKVKPIFEKIINTDCKELMKNAQIAWNKGEDYDAANEAAVFLRKIDPASSCYSDLERLVSDIKKELRKDENEIKDEIKENKEYKRKQAEKEWDFILQKQRDLTAYKLKEIEAYKQVNIERAKNQKKTDIYNIKEWFK